nr:MAG TPA: hypothetical protein [Caudoviricetes sp.]
MGVLNLTIKDTQGIVFCLCFSRLIGFDKITGVFYREERRVSIRERQIR